MTNPLVSIVIVTWNRREDVLKAIQSAYDQDYREVEIIIVDNGSTDGTVEALEQDHPQVNLVALDHNVGASAGRNAGIAVAGGEIVFFLDSDAILDVDTLSGIVQKFEAEPNLGIIMCRILDPYTRELDPLGWIYPERHRARQDMEFLSYSFAEGGAAIRKEVIDQTGPFWDQLFFGREGEELSLRVWDAGYGILYWPQAVIYHRGSKQKRVAHGRREYFDLRNSLYIYLVRYPWWMLAFFAPLRIAISVFRAFRRGFVHEILPAFPELVRDLPSLWDKRHPISNKTARRYIAMQRQHGPLSWDLASWLRYKT